MASRSTVWWGNNTWLSILPVLRQGSSGEAVKGLQRELVDAGYPVTVDGSFGPATNPAVRGDQSKAGLLVDGMFPFMRGVGGRGRGGEQQ